ncbi:hypothetical protein BJX99DRAFT_265739 [Aspergillus californicus]
MRKIVLRSLRELHELLSLVTDDSHPWDLINGEDAFEETDGSPRELAEASPESAKQLPAYDGLSTEPDRVEPFAPVDVQYVVESRGEALDGNAGLDLGKGRMFAWILAVCASRTVGMFDNEQENIALTSPSDPTGNQAFAEGEQRARQLQRFEIGLENRLGDNYIERGGRSDAGGLVVELVGIRKVNLGQENREAMDTVAELAGDYREQGRSLKTRELWTRMVNICKTTLPLKDNEL